MRRFVPLLFGCLFIVALAGGAARGQSADSSPPPPPAGRYACLVSRLQYSSVQGPAGPLMLFVYDPSALGNLVLDGKGEYRVGSKSQPGRYAYDPLTGRFKFESGSLRGWPAVYEKFKDDFIVRLAGNKGESVSLEKALAGEHTCTLRTDGAKPDDAKGAATVKQRAKSGGRRSRPRH